MKKLVVHRTKVVISGIYHRLKAWFLRLPMAGRGGKIMKTVLLAGVLTLVAGAAQAQYYGTGSNTQSHPVQGHVTTSGTYVAPYVATNPNTTQRDNYSATGNVNPYTGAVGTRTPKY